MRQPVGGIRGWPVALVAVALALLPAIASAQEATSPDRDAVMLWTAIVAVLVLAACAIGYAWRRMRGMDHPTPDELEMMGGGHEHGEEHGAAAHH